MDSGWLHFTQYLSQTSRIRPVNMAFGGEGLSLRKTKLEMERHPADTFFAG